MKKIILLISFVFFFTGCSATYELEIFDEDYREKITVNGISSDKDNMGSWEIPINYDTTIEDIKTSSKLSDQEYYHKSHKNNSYTYYHEFAMEDYFKSYFVNSAYEFFAVYYDDYEYENMDAEDFDFDTVDPNAVTISTSFENKLFTEYKDLEKIDVIIKTNHKVISSNADEVRESSYIWHIDRDNFSEKSVQIKFYKDEYVLNYENSLVKTLLLVGGVLALGIVLTIILKKKANSSNKIF